MLWKSIEEIQSTGQLSKYLLWCKMIDEVIKWCSKSSLIFMMLSLYNYTTAVMHISIKMALFFIFSSYCIVCLQPIFLHETRTCHYENSMKSHQLLLRGKTQITGVTKMTNWISIVSPWYWIENKWRLLIKYVTSQMFLFRKRCKFDLTIFNYNFFNFRSQTFLIQTCNWDALKIQDSKIFYVFKSILRSDYEIWFIW